jgi:hypothetical protein
MENNNKKSKAFIITFVIVLIVLGGLYLLYQNKETVLGTKGASTMEKVFSPLLGSSKNKDLNVVENPESNKNISTSEGEGDQNSNNTEISKEGNGNDPSNIEDANFDGKYSLPKPSAGFGSSSFNSNSIWGNNNNNNNSRNGDSDSRNGYNSDSGSDRDSNGYGKSDYDLNYKNEDDDYGNELSRNACYGQAPLVFTEDEIKMLDEHLKRYYAISPTLKSESSISNIKEDSSSKKALVSRVNMITSICEEQTSDPNFTGPKEVLANPYWPTPSTITIRNGEENSYLKGEDFRRTILERDVKLKFDKETLCDSLPTRKTYLEKLSCKNTEEPVDSSNFIETLFGIW